MNAPTKALESADRNQKLAAEPEASVFVTANAGSGKTKVLVDRIARLLLSGSTPSAFLCITYTKAAAAEMQRRLFERLGAWCVADDVKLAAELTKLGSPPRNPADLGVARALFAQALETPGGLKIQTIHAFCERLLARFPLEAGVPPGFDIADEARARALLQMARAHCIRSADPSCDAAFMRFAARMMGESLEGLLDRLVWRRGDFKRFAAAHGGLASATARIKARHGAEDDAEVFAAACLARAPWEALRRAAPVLAESGANDQKAGQRIGAALAAYDAGGTREALEALIRVALKDGGEARARLVSNGLLDKHPWLDALCAEVTTFARAALDGLNAIDRAEDAAAALALALSLDASYEAAKARFGALDFDDLIAHAHALLSRSDAAPWVLFKIDGGLDHILIDEGQDTSPSQWELIAPLQEEFFAGAGARERVRTMFAVGDPKQSIYAFQGADPDRFLDEARKLEARARIASRTFVAPVLETSFRSSPEILQIVDAVFKDRDLAPGGPESQNEVRHLPARENEPGLVEVWPLCWRPKRAEGEPWDAPLDVETETSVHATLAKAIAREAKGWLDRGEGVWDKDTRALRPMRAGDILALVRTRGALFRELIKAFKREGLPVVGPDRMVLKEELAVEDALALIRVALDPADDLALACVLKGPWCDLDDDDADLFPLAHARAKGETLLSRLMASATAKYAPARAFIAGLIARSDKDAFALLSWALDTPHDDRTGWSRVLSRVGAEARDPLEELLARALAPGAHAAPSLQRFLYEIETDAGQVKREMEAAGGAVRVMTVHGAKGLEAPVVILPDATAPAADKPEDGLIFNEDGPFLSPNEKSDDEAMRAARQAHKQRASGEHLRLLYVAMTRARDRLIVCGAQHGNAKSGEAEEGWRFLVDQARDRVGGVACETPFGEGWRVGAAHLAAPETLVGAAITALPSWTRVAVGDGARIDPAAPSRLHRVDPAVFSPRGDGQKRFRRGRLIHGLLQRLPEVTPARRADAASAWLKRQRVEAHEADALAKEALGVIADARFAAVFGPASRAEVPIVGEAAGRPVRGIVDRLALDETGVLILDFKTDRPAPERAEDAPDAYLLQMALYRAVLRKIFPEKPVRCALLWTEAPRLMPLHDSLMDGAFDRFARG